jgi:hypothetical protein
MKNAFTVITVAIAPTATMAIVLLMEEADLGQINMCSGIQFPSSSAQLP